jgi:hypothetical protein
VVWEGRSREAPPYPDLRSRIKADLADGSYSHEAATAGFRESSNWVFRS